MSDTHIIEVHTAPPYRVHIGPGLLNACGGTVAAAVGRCRLAVIADSTVAPLYLDTALNSLRRAGYDAPAYIYPAGEAHKNLETLAGILEFLASEHLTRSDCVAALGGGVCGDMAGFAAGVYLRGVRYVQLPTTLLSAVDSSVGGKTAIDLRAGKNLAGVFLQPSAVVCDTDTLGTLPQEALADGAAEAVKTAVLSGGELFALLETGGLRRDAGEIAARCVAFKAKVVEEDPLDNGVRRTLNLGHTAGHAIEKLADFTVSHGHAVAMGMVLMARAAERLGWAAEPVADRVAGALRQNGLPTTAAYSAKDLAEAALSDKKRRGDAISLVVPRRIGDCFMKTIPVSELESVFAAGLEG